MMTVSKIQDRTPLACKFYLDFARAEKIIELADWQDRRVGRSHWAEPAGSGQWVDEAFSNSSSQMETLTAEAGVYGPANHVRNGFAMEMTGLTHSDEMPPLLPRRPRLALLLFAVPPSHPSILPSLWPGWPATYS